ncbi:MAG: S41 family peptidase [Anaerovoracaceae bacterium]|jgi:carboxyl-terminal processing protease
MVTLKKRNLIILLIVILSAGILLTAGYHQIYGIVTDQIGISAEEYEDYQRMKQNYGRLDSLMQLIEQKYYVPVDTDKLYEGIYKGLFAGIGDPYSAYLNKQEYENLQIAASGEFEGIGVTIAPDKNGYINVVAPIDDTPAFKAGIKSEDKIIAVDGVDYNGETIDAAVAAMRGKEGTEVTIRILRGDTTLEFTLKRAKIILQTVKAEMLDGEIGYIRISSFEKHTAEDFRKALRNMELSGVKGLIIDLRDNPGGLVDVCIEIADSLLPEGIITYTEDRQGQRNYYKSDPGATEIPFVVMINGGSASASEIVAGAVKDSGVGKIVGTTSYGKGIIQEIVELNNGDATKLTVMQYFSPKGNVIHEKGVEPDYIVEITQDDLTEGVLLKENDKQLKKALELLK